MKVLEKSLYSTPLTIEKIAGLLGWSARTVRYDLSLLDEELRQKGWILHRKAKKGVWLEAAEPKVVAGEVLRREDYVYSKEERCWRIITALLAGRTAIDDLAEALAVSRNTLLLDLRQVRQILAERKIQYYSKRGQGIWADGSEQAVRDLFIHIFALRLHDFRNFAAASEPADCLAALLHEYARDLPVGDVTAFFFTALRRQNVRGNDNSFNRMICALIVQLRRLGQGRRIGQVPEVEFVSVESHLLQRFADELASQLQIYHPGFRRPEEIRFIMRELLHSKIYIFAEEYREGVLHQDSNKASLDLAKIFIEFVQIWLGDIYVDDDELIYNLALHLQPAIERAKYGIELTNPLLGQIRQQYSALFTVAMKAAEKLEQQLKIKLSEDEVGYLTIHIGAAVERRRMRRVRTLEVLLVCGNGVGTANLLAITLRSRLPYLQIKQTVSLYEVEGMALEDIDIVISTVPLVLKDRAVLRVSPILTEAEIPVIENQIQYFYNKKYAPAAIGAARQASSLRLMDVLQPATIQLDAEAGNWETAIREAGRLLITSGAVEARYVDRMVQCVKEIGPYIVVGPGIAMPHSRCEDGVRQVGMSLLRLKHPVCFGNEENDPVDLVFAFGTIDEKTHLGILSDLWTIFTDPEALGKLRSCGSSREIVVFLQQYFSGGKTGGACKNEGSLC